MSLKSVSRLRAAAFAACILGAPLPIALAQAPAPAPPQQPPQPIEIDRGSMLVLIRSAMLALDHANKTGNYTVLRDLGAPGFQSANSPARLAEIFANLRARNLDLSGAAVLEPQLTQTPVNQGGLMRMSGIYPGTVPVSFDLLFQPVEGRWRLIGISVSLGAPQSAAGGPAPATPSTPATPPAPTAEAKPETKPEAKPETKPAPAAPARAAPRRVGPAAPQ
jgi:hypothetical protein